MLAALKGIVDGIAAILGFLVSSITGIIRVFILIGDSFAFLLAVGQVLPSFLSVFLAAGICLLIVFFLIGR